MKTAMPLVHAGPARARSLAPPRATGKQTPRRMRRAAEIIAAAREAFLEKGFERTSVSEIAAKVGVVEGLLYSYFPTKRDMLNEVLKGMYEPLIHDIEDSFSRMQGLRSRLRFLIWRHLRVYVEEPGLSRLVLHEVRTRPEYFDSALHDLHVRYTGFLISTLEEAKLTGELPATTDAEMIRSLVYGGIEHRMWGVLFGRQTVNVEEAADDITALVLGGISPGTVAPAPKAALQTSQREIERRLDRLERIVAAQATQGPNPS
ncbi:MAG: TetR/AcrR family transcriptional regulator [Pseudomonadota bacterium]